ncbi:uncharacterized protein L199_005063 [Kwoniella botswanensis]|uniref:uncharacterized protein n=1 Tax=Kwoniella botswanensis TaxID=1268659 RepID=UPI00315D20D1
MSFYGYGSQPPFHGASTSDGFYTERHVPGGGRTHYTRSSSAPGYIPRGASRARPRPATSNLRYNRRGQVDPNGHTIKEWQSRFGEWFDENYDASDRLTRDRINMDFVDHITSGRAAEMNGYDKGNRRSTWSDSYRRPSHRSLIRSHRSHGSRWGCFISSVFQAVGDLFTSPSHGTTSLLDKGPGSTRAIYKKRGRSTGRGAFIRSRRR